MDNTAIANAKDTDQAIGLLSDDQVSFGYYTATVVVSDKDETVAYEKQREVERIINSLGFVTVNETINAVESWLSSIPGHCVANVRMPLLHSLNLAHLMPLSAQWSGPVENSHLKDAPLMITNTSNFTPFRLCNHVNDVGHQMIVGPTGTGKSVLLNMSSFIFGSGHKYQEEKKTGLINQGSVISFFCVLLSIFFSNTEYKHQEITAANIHKSPAVKYKLYKLFKLPFRTIAKAPSKDKTIPVN